MLASMFEKFRTRNDRVDQDFDTYAATFGEPLDIESLLIIRAMEDFFIDGNLMLESERQVVPEYLKEEWDALFGGEDEPLRPREVH